MLDLAEEGHFNLRKAYLDLHLSVKITGGLQGISSRSEMGIYISKMLLELVKAGVVIKS